MIKVYNETLYLVKQTNNKYKVVNGNLTAKGTVLYSLEKTTLDSHMKPIGSWYYTPQFISADDVEEYKATVEAIADMVPMAASSTTLVINGQEIDISFDGTETTPTLVCNVINAAAEAQIGTDYNNIAQVVGNRVKLVAPSAPNSFFVIPPNSVWQSYLFIPSGEYAGDLPYPDRTYAENEYYILYQESVTPNNGTASGKFYPTVADNNMLHYTSEFDRNLIEANPRTKLLFDSFAFVMGRIDSEMTRFIDQLDISKIDTDQLEAMAYLFGIPVDSLIRADGSVSAREMLKTIMRVIQDKGSNASFELLMRIAGFNTSVKEYYADDSEVDKTIDSSILDAFVERFLNKQSIFRSPYLCYGSSVSDLSLLPTVGYQDEIITVLPPSIDKGIYKYDVVNGWELQTSDTDPKFGQGAEIDSTIADLGFRFKFIEEPWRNISVDEWNNTRVLNGFDIRPGFNTTLSGTIREIVSIPLRAELISVQVAPWDLSLTQNKVLNLLVNNSIAYNIDFSAFETQIADYSAVTFDEIKYIIENNYPELVAINDSGKLMLRSRRIGQGSSIKCYTNNTGFGYVVGQSHQINYFVDQFQVDVGQANPSETITQIPQVTSVATTIKLQSEDLNQPLDGTYTLWVDSVGDIVVSSDKLFHGTLYSPGLGWVTKDVGINSIAKIGTVQIINGQIAYITDVTHRDDVVLSDNFTSEQEKAILAFIRSKTNVAHRTGPVTISEGAPYPFSQPFYFRDGTENVLNTAEKGYSNEIVLDSTAIKSDFILTYDIIKQLEIFIKYVRPVHISALTILLNVPELFDSWVRAYDRTQSGDYIPGFWDGRQSIERLMVSGTAVAGSFATGYDGIYSSLGALTTVPSEVNFYINGILQVGGYSISGGSVVSASLLGGESVTVEFYYKDGKNGNQTKTQLDIMERLYSAFGTKEGLFTDGDAYASTPPSGENEITEWADHVKAQRNNNFSQATTNGAISNYLGTTEYETEWLNGITNWVSTKQLGQAKFAVSTTRHQDVTVDTTSIIRLDTANTLANDIAVGETVTFYNSAGAYIYTAVAGAPVGRQFQVGTDPANSLSNLASSINANDPLLMTATYSNYVLTVVSAANNYITVDSNIDSSKYAVYNEYYAPKKPMITSFVNGLILGQVYESAKTAVTPTFMTDHNTSLAYYDYSHYMHRGHSDFSKDTTSIGTETSYLNDFYYRGLDNTNFTYNWETATYDIADIRDGTPHYHGSERYDGGPNITTGNVNDLSDQYYLEFYTPTVGHYRNQGMHNAEPLKMYAYRGGRLNINTPSGAFTVGETITGGTSLQTAVVVSYDPDYLIVKTQSGAFTVGETLTGGTSLKTAIYESFEGNAADFSTDKFIVLKSVATDGTALATILADTTKNHELTVY